MSTPALGPLPPPAGQNRPHTTIGLCIAMIVLPSVAIILRFWSRAVSHGVRFWWDDWLALAALPPTLAVCAVVIACAKAGLGTHVYQVVESNPGNIDLISKYLYAGALLYDVAISLAKFSALFFYLRVFPRPGNKQFQVAVWGTFALALAWLIYAFFFTVFQCTPVQAAFNSKLKATATCVTAFTFFTSTAVSNLVIDVVILLLPLPMLWRLQMKFSRKLLIAGVFICGYCVVFMSVGRLIAIAEVSADLDTDYTYNITQVVQWSMVEPSIAVLSICLPAIFHLAKRTSDQGALSLLSFPIHTGTDLGNKRASALPSSEASRLGRANSSGDDSEGFVRLRGQSSDSIITRLQGGSDAGVKFSATAFLAHHDDPTQTRHLVQRQEQQQQQQQRQQEQDQQRDVKARSTPSPMGRSERERERSSTPQLDIPLRSIHVRTDLEISEDVV